MFEVGQRVFQAQIKANGIIETIRDGKIIIRYHTQEGKRSPYRSVYSPRWIRENPNLIHVAPMGIPPFHAREIAELEASD